MIIKTGDVKWLLAQEEFLKTFYGEVTDPETKLKMLAKKLGKEVENFYATDAKPEKFITLTIKFLEHDLLVANNLFKPDYR
jgi:hypothetical protein